MKQDNVMAVMSLDVARVRGLYPTLGGGVAHLDGALGALQPESVIRAIIATLRRAPAQPGSGSTRSQRSQNSAAQLRRAIADLVGTAADEVVLGPSLPALTRHAAALMSRDWQLGDELVLSRLDSDGSVDAWLRAARAAGVGVRWAEVDLETGELPDWQYERLVTRRTRLVSLPLANLATGTVPRVSAIAEIAHRHGALVMLDAGAALPHLAVDLTELGADLIGVSGHSFGGPTVAALAARPGLLSQWDDGPAAVGQNWETQPLPVELLDGFTAAVDHLAGLDESATGTRRERITASVRAAGSHTRGLYQRLDAGLRSLPWVTVLGTATDRVPAAAFTVARRTPGEVGSFLHRRGVSVWTGPSGMTELLSAVGADELGGACFVGLLPYNTEAEVDLLLGALAELAP